MKHNLLARSAFVFNLPSLCFVIYILVSFVIKNFKGFIVLLSVLVVVGRSCKQNNCNLKNQHFPLLLYNIKISIFMREATGETNHSKTTLKKITVNLEPTFGML